MDQQVDNGAVRFDDGKLRMDLIPPEAEEAMAEILGYGTENHAERNWERGMNWSRCYASLRRHLNAWWKGEDLDPESLHPHINHVLWNAMALATYYARGAGKDDRPGKVKDKDDDLNAIFKKGMDRMVKGRVKENVPGAGIVIIEE